MRVDIKIEEKSNKNYQIFIDELSSLKIDKKVAIITNPKVSGLHLKTLLNKLEAKELYIVTIPDGEEYKNLDTISFILDRLNEHRLDRKSLLIAFGGGVIGDMTGFAASIFLRGVDFIQIPTTLLSQVDASVGGKTGVNNKFGKNLIGSFYQPKAVYCETSFLETLPKREFSAGVAEMIKMALTFDEDFFKWLENNSLYEKKNLKYAIKKCIEIKAEVVSMDEKEAGVRAVLNYGHTFAHVIENQTQYKRYLHGEAVAIGIVFANFLSKKLNLISNEQMQRVVKLLQRYNLPTTYPIDNLENFYDSFFLDKKTDNRQIKFILLNGLGDYKMVNDIDKNTVLSALKDATKK